MTRAVSGHDRQLDAAVAVEVAGFRWVVWNEAALGGAPLATPGRFLAHPDDLLAHLHLPAGAEAPLAAGSLDRVPRFTEDLDAAVRAAEGAGLFAEAGAAVRRRGDGAWVVEIAATGEGVEGEKLADAVCRAALRWARHRRLA